MGSQFRRLRKARRGRPKGSIIKVEGKEKTLRDLTKNLPKREKKAYCAKPVGIICHYCNVYRECENSGKPCKYRTDQAPTVTILGTKLPWKTEKHRGVTEKEKC